MKKDSVDTHSPSPERRHSTGGSWTGNMMKIGESRGDGSTPALTDVRGFLLSERRRRSSYVGSGSGGGRRLSSSQAFSIPTLGAASGRTSGVYYEGFLGHVIPSETEPDAGDFTGPLSASPPEILSPQRRLQQRQQLPCVSLIATVIDPLVRDSTRSKVVYDATLAQAMVATAQDLGSGTSRNSGGGRGSGSFAAPPPPPPLHRRGSVFGCCVSASTTASGSGGGLASLTWEPMPSDTSGKRAASLSSYPALRGAVVSGASPPFPSFSSSSGPPPLSPQTSSTIHGGGDSNSSLRHGSTTNKPLTRELNTEGVPKLSHTQLTEAFYVRSKGDVMAKDAYRYFLAEAKPKNHRSEPVAVPVRSRSPSAIKKSKNSSVLAGGRNASRGSSAGSYSIERYASATDEDLMSRSRSSRQSAHPPPSPTSSPPLRAMSRTARGGSSLATSRSTAEGAAAAAVPQSHCRSAAAAIAAVMGTDGSTRRCPPMSTTLFSSDPDVPQWPVLPPYASSSPQHSGGAAASLTPHRHHHHYYYQNNLRASGTSSAEDANTWSKGVEGKEGSSVDDLLRQSEALFQEMTRPGGV